MSDVHLAAPDTSSAAIIDFYQDLIGLLHLQDASEGSLLVFGGYPLSGPRVVVDRAGDVSDRRVRRQLLVQVPSLFECEALLADRGSDFERFRGLSFYDRRLAVLDPGGNRVELVASHPW